MDSRDLKKKIYKDSVSITHRHLLSVINTIVNEESALKNRPTIKILDAGCGDGNLTFFLNKYLPQFHKETTFELFGYDVKDHGVQPSGFTALSIKKLRKEWPEINWEKRIRFISSKEPWPFENNSFDIVISNQVLEHVWDHNHFFFEQYRVLKEKGFSVHLFPVKEVMYDGHVFLPWVHKLKSWDSIYKHVKFLSRIGLGSYKKEKSKFNNDVELFSRVWADKLYHYCNYKTYKEIAGIAKDNHLCITPRFTLSMYKRKFWELCGKKIDFNYQNKPSSGFLFYFLKRISGVCFVMYKGEYSGYNLEDSFSTTDY